MTNQLSFKIENETAFIEGVIDFESVKHVHNEGIKWLKAPSEKAKQFDFSRVSNCNSAATALIIDWLRQGKHYNQQVVILKVPQSLRDLMHLAGLEDVLEKDIA